jgi:hypothetical protein
MFRCKRMIGRSFARGYNGPNYLISRYDVRSASEFIILKGTRVPRKIGSPSRISGSLMTTPLVAIQPSPSLGSLEGVITPKSGFHPKTPSPRPPLRPCSTAKMVIAALLRLKAADLYGWRCSVMKLTSRIPASRMASSTPSTSTYLARVSTRR